MRTRYDPGWNELVARWKQTQIDLRKRVKIRALRTMPRFVAGVDAAFTRDKKTVLAAAVVYDRAEQRIVEVSHASEPAEVPYLPGFLSFREGPAVLRAIKSLKHSFDLICFDGQGLAHPRRCGLATHLSVTLDVPGIGVAKSRLTGTFKEPGRKRGSSSPLMDQSEQIGLVLRTRDGVRPLFVSIGHRIDLEWAAKVVMGCCGRYRIPEPTRQADIEVGLLKRRFGNLPDSDDTK